MKNGIWCRACPEMGYTPHKRQFSITGFEDLYRLAKTGRALYQWWPCAKGAKAKAPKMTYLGRVETPAWGFSWIYNTFDQATRHMVHFLFLEPKTTYGQLRRPKKETHQVNLVIETRSSNLVTSITNPSMANSYG